jgi:hypothetical protein
MDLLEDSLPEATLSPDVDVAVFFGRCEAIAQSHGWVIDRRREYAGPGYDQLNIHLEADDPGYPMLRMVASPRRPAKLSLDVVAAWTGHTIEYDEYVQTLRDSYGLLLDAYARAHSKRLRLGMPHRPPRLDIATIDCNRIRYASEKLGGLARTLAIGEGDARDRLINAFSTFHVIRPDDLPEPLKGHLKRVYEQITRKPARHQMEGSVEATVRTMKNATAAAILERLLEIADAVQIVQKVCDDRRGAANER